MDKDLLKRIAILKNRPDALKDLSNVEFVDLILQLIVHVKTVYKAIEDGKVKGKDARELVADVDFLSKKSAQSIITASLNQAITDTEKKIAKRLAQLKNGEDGKDGKDAVITDKVKQDIAKIASDFIEIPDVATIINANPEAIRNALELLQGDERLNVKAISGLEEQLAIVENKIEQTKRDVTAVGGTNKNLINATINERIEAGDIGSGGGGAVDSVNGQTGVVVLDTDDIADTATNRYTNDTDITRLANTSGTNTGDQDISGKADKSGSLTQFVGNTAHRVFYADGSGDVQELALGADGTFLKSNGASVAPSFDVPSGSGAVDSVNGQTGTVVLDADDIDDTATTNKFTTAGDITKLAGIETGADVTDTTNVTAAGALMDSELADITAIKTLQAPDNTTISTFGASIIDDADEAAFKATVNLEIGVDVQAYSSVLAATTASFLTADETKLDGIEAGAEVNNISDANATDLTDGGASTLHYHASDRDRANHTGTQTASTISDFDTEVSNNTDVAANTSARHAALTVTDSSEIDFTLTGQDLTASLKSASIDETKLDASVNASLDLADSALQAANISDTAYDATSWNAVTTVAPSKNAVRDKIETMDSAIALNTAKVTNATHSGDMTGATALTAQPALITGKSAATVASGDLVLIADINDSNNLKQVTAQSIADLGGGGGGNTELDVTQSSHGFAVGDVIKYASGAYAKAQADSVANAEAVGVVSAVADVNNFTVTQTGYVTGLSGLTANTVYFLSPSSAGAITATEPSTVGQVSKPVFFATSTSAGWVLSYRGMLISSADNLRKEVITYHISGGGSPIATGAQEAFVKVPYAGTITGYEIVADQTGSIVVDVWKDTYANYPPTDTDSITASAPITISSANKAQDNTITGWITGITEGDLLRFNVDSASTVTAVTIFLLVTRT
jgi:hypothetical protein